MSVDYDLIIWGGSPAGTYAAVMAAQYGARVALILPPESSHSYTVQDCLRLPLPLRSGQNGRYPMRDGEALSYERLCQWVQVGVETLALIDSPAALEQLGVDLIYEGAEFEEKGGQISVALRNRRLLSCAYLLAPATDPRVEIEGLASTGYLTPKSLASLQSVPSCLAIIGSAPCGVELAHLFQELGSKVTLITENSRLLPQEEPEVSDLIQCQLEALGVEILGETQVTQARLIEDKTWLQVGNRAIAFDKLLLVTPPALPFPAPTLELLGIDWTNQHLRVNNKLQTTNPKIYACGDILGGYSLPHISLYEAKLALKNALFLPFFTLDYQQLPYTIYSKPTLARVGLTEAGARRRYGDKVQVIQEQLKMNPAAVLSGEVTGFIKVIVQPDGRILGATVLGTRAEEVIQSLSLAINHQIKVQALPDSPGVFGSVSQLLTRVGDRWQLQQFHQSFWSQTFLKWWLSWKRG
ncbi:NAD(P)/FAD-dependent oxidoreductase [Roseofilum sp. BLCC_M154]|uniref:NAD(P)/FAD-dependent oxidoreductase n=1 Tax=Roseofilum acuticapitatum BLCC-M154 TaxID=3022444 RepID=A0ABT7AYK3_9CYAN|nr:NAD(P)/FAD-dependent oxidoreductase [Roseofilum acuticapitatum]MDJ1171971.1 NAD(P)/FAD-dependent oxidoreductase [Roseofilum acuticapitatum BLCC-M154]